MSITKNAMVLNMSLGLWTGYRLDKEASRKITDDAGADADAARVNKHLVPKEAFKDIAATSNAIRNHFYAKTLPWKDNGDRLLTRLGFAKFIEEHERLVGEFDKAVDKFLARDYPAAVDRASFRMGDLFDQADYPSAVTLRHKFYVNLDIDAVTEAGDFRVAMEAEQVDAIRAQMTKALEQRIGAAMHSVWDQIAKVVGHFAETMGEKDKVFRNSTVRNIEELVDLLPGLNVTEDPELEQVRIEIKARLCGYDPKDLRQDPAVRFEAAGEAKKILDQMSGFMNAFKLQEAA